MGRSHEVKSAAAFARLNTKSARGRKQALPARLLELFPLESRFLKEKA
jgi:hypothetical protein